jgi:hypothetical protein
MGSIPPGACGSAAGIEDDLAVNGRRVLISGASVAGPVLAYWLNQFGFQPAVVERTEELRFGSGGHA